MPKKPPNFLFGKSQNEKFGLEKAKLATLFKYIVSRACFLPADPRGI